MKRHGLCCALLLFCTTLTQAGEQPERIFEIGVGAFALHVPEYAGAKDYRQHIVPLPYVYYQDKHIKVDRDGLLSSLWQTQRLYVDFSVSAQLPVNSDDVAIRSGMPDIDWTFQLGGAIKYYLSGTPSADNKLFTELFTRKAIMTDFSSLSDAGWQYGTALHAQHTLVAVNQGQLTWQNRLTVNFASETYQDVYYQVDKQYQLADRPAFDAKSGYLGTSLSSGLVYRKEQWWLAGFVLYRHIGGSKNENSPLVQQKENVSVGLGLAWVFN